MRITSLFIVALLSLTVLLSGVSNTMAMDHAHMQSNPIQATGHHNDTPPDNPGIHIDLCGMTVCGPFVMQLADGNVRNAVIVEISYRLMDDHSRSRVDDPRLEPPRTVAS